MQPAAWAPPDFVALYAAVQPGRLAAVDLATGRSWAYAALHDAIARCVTVLDACGVAAGDRVAVLARNSVEQLVLHLACARAGAVFVPFNWRLATTELEYLIGDADPVLFLFDEACAAAAQAIAGGRKVMTIAGLRDEIAVAGPAVPGRIDADAASILLYTSGTSGRPKGVIITERNAFFTGVNFGVLARVSNASVFLCESPMFHVIGLVTSLRAPLQQGGTVLVSDGFDPARTNSRLGDATLGVTHYFCVPQMAAMLRADPGFAPQRFAGRATIFTGGAPIEPADAFAWLDDGVAFVNGYGMTEVGTATGMPVEPDLIRERPRSAGPTTPTQQLRIVDDDGADLADGTIGEIWLRGPNVSPGYWNRPEDTAKAFTADGWFRTGDAAFRDADGFVTLVDRKKDMFISGGENVYPAEIEAVLMTHPDIAEAVVIGVADPRWGEVGHGIVVLRAGAALDAEALAAHCAERIARYKVPKSFVAAVSLPRTGSGKVLKHVLKAAYQPG